MQESSLLTPHLETSSPSSVFQCSWVLPHAHSSLLQSSLMNLYPLIWLRPKPAAPISQNSWALSAQVSPTQIMWLLVPSSSSVNHADVFTLARLTDAPGEEQIQWAAFTCPVPKGRVLHTRHSSFLAFVTLNSSHLSLMSRYSEEISEGGRWQESLEGHRRLQRPMETWEWLGGLEMRENEAGSRRCMTDAMLTLQHSHITSCGPKGQLPAPTVSESLCLQPESMEALFCWADSRFSTANFTASSLKVFFSGSINLNKAGEKITSSFI